MPPPILTFCALLAALTVVTIAQPVPRTPDEVLILEDTFDVFNLTLWKHELTLSGEGNWEFELYTNNRTSSYVHNGSLYLLPGLTADIYGAAAIQNGLDLNVWGGSPADYCTSNAFFGCERTAGAGGNDLNPVFSARVRTAETFAFKYGRIEVTARLPRGDWLWPAIWLMPTNNAYGTWPVSGEIDIVESRGNARGYPAGGCETASSTLHYGPFYPLDGYPSTHATYTAPTGDLSTAYHVYGLFWNATLMQTYIDDTPILTVDLTAGGANASFWGRGGWSDIDNPWEGGGANAPFDQRFYLIMNVAVGGTNSYFPDGEGGKPWSNTSPHAINDFLAAQNEWLPSWPRKAPGGGFTGGGSPMMIDSVRVWQSPQSGGDFALRPML